ncbi:hypothetical protein ACFYWS_25335 [Streptomyces sp. NPDC002795]|uniref:hypothetical protein n=1 Tax=Streptomyces sp. NPDC002795 TaxID=3364665 RepID=UPI0036BA1F42
MPSSLSRRHERRRRYTAIASAALAVIGVVGWQLSVMGPKPGSHAPMEICALNNTTLRADVDADGHQDEIYDKTREGDPLVTFGGGDTVRVEKARWFWQKFRGVWVDDMETRGTFGDFDGDGYIDLALFYSQHDTGDSPEDNMITHEGADGGRPTGAVRGDRGDAGPDPLRPTGHRRPAQPGESPGEGARADGGSGVRSADYKT